MGPGRGGRLLLAAAAIVTGAFAKRAYDAKVRELGRGFAAGQATRRRGVFACQRCRARFPLEAGEGVPPCPACDHPRATKVG